MKIIISFFSLIIAGFIAFYLWAVQPVLVEKDYVNQSRFSEFNEIWKDTFSVMTYNIGYLSGMTNNLPVDRDKEFMNSNLVKAAQLIRELNPDIIAFQEIDFRSKRSFFIDQYSQLAKLASYPFGAMVVNWDKKYVPFPYWPLRFHFGEILSGQAILSKTKILSNSRIVLPKPESNSFFYNDFYLDRLIQKVWIDTGNDSILMLNVHFEAWDSETREIQAKIALEIFNEYQDKYAIILLGDFNSHFSFASVNMNEKTIDIILSNKNISSALTKKDYLANPEEFFTFNSQKPYEKIDYIFYNNKYLNCIDIRVVREAKQISDHLPILALFSFKN